jgi:thermopsin
MRAAAQRFGAVVIVGVLLGSGVAGLGAYGAAKTPRPALPAGASDSSTSGASAGAQVAGRAETGTSAEPDACVPGAPGLSGEANDTVDPGGGTPVSGGSAAGGAPSASGNLTPSADGSIAPLIATAEANGVCPAAIFPPRPAATPAQVAAASQTKLVAPLYKGTPAPVGLADYGLSATKKGTVVATSLSTRSVRGTVDANATGILPFVLGSTTPDAYAIQLNAVLTSVDLRGHEASRTRPLVGKPFDFWVQNVVEYYPSSDYMVLITNLWNFSGNASLGSAIYAHGPWGEVLGDEVYEAVLAIPTPITYPFNLTLFLNSTTVGGREAVNFSAQLVGPGESFSDAYDYVIFNSTTPAGRGTARVAHFVANGRKYNPAGLTSDFELDIGGPGDGSQADLFAADATLGLAYWDPSADHRAGAYVSVPSALNFGGDTGETATGANVAWSNAPGGIPGLSDYGTMTTGPTFLGGLWNAGGPEGSYPVTINAFPSNAFEIVTPPKTPLTPSTGPEPSVAFTVTTDTFWLAPGSYTLTTELSDYQPVVTPLSVSGPLNLSVGLAPDPSLGVYTPLWAWTNAQVAALSSSGAGTPADPYVLVNNHLGPIGPTFGLYNDYAYPVFPSIYLSGTDVSVEVADPGNFTTETNDFTAPGPSLPQTNAPPFWFVNVSGLALLNATGPWGWFAAPVVTAPGGVVFYDSSNDLIANCTFPGGGPSWWGLGLFVGGDFWGGVNNPGGHNTIWGNTFLLGRPNGPGAGADIGLLIAEPNDTTYNNQFVPAISPDFESEGIPDYGIEAWSEFINLYTGESIVGVNLLWNITPQPASVAHFAAGFPTIPLVGSILGTSTQGGNYWWDYGDWLNPYGDLPFDANFYGLRTILPGDYAPLTATPLSAITLNASGLSAGAAWWHLTLTEAGEVLENFTTDVSSRTFYLPNGTYSYLLSVPAGYVWTGGTLPPAGTLTVAGANVTESFSYGAGTTCTLTVTETGLPPPIDDFYPIWSVELGTSVFASIDAKIVIGNLTPADTFGGEYAYSIPSWGLELPIVELGGVEVPAQGNLSLDSNTTLSVTFVPAYYMEFNETGLAAGRSWSVTLGNVTETAPAGNVLFFVVAAGTYPVTVAPETGYSVSSYPSSLAIPPGDLFISVTFTPTG